MGAFKLFTLSCATLATYFLASAEASLQDLDVVAHDVRVWNLVGPCSVESDIPFESLYKCAFITNPILSHALGATCSLTKTAWRPIGGCPNIGAFEISDEEFEPFAGKLGADVVASVVSTIGMPAAVMAYFEASGRFNMSINGTSNARNSSGWLPDYISNSEFKFKTAVDLKAKAFAHALAFPSIIEWEDKKGDGKFDPVTSTVVSTYHLSDHSLSSSEGTFSPMSVKIAKGLSGSTMYSMSAATWDKVFEISFETTNLAHVGTDGEMRKPNSAKISIAINNFPYKKENTKLALQAVVLNANAGGEVDLSNDGSHFVINGDDAQGIFDWKDTATVVRDGKLSNVTVISSVTDGKDVIQNLSYSAANAVMFENAAYGAKVVYFTFDVAHSDNIVWDPSLGVLANQSSSVVSGLEWALLVVAAVAAIAGISFLVWRAYRIRQLKKQQNEGYRALLSAYDLE